MRLGNLRIHWKIMILSFGIVLFSLVLGGIILFGSYMRLKETELGRRLLITARTAAELPDVRSSVMERDGWRRIQPIADRLRIINDATYIVVMDMKRTRMAHPIEARIGGKFDGSDAEPAFAEHTYVSKVKGEMGTAVRAFVPIMNDAHEQIGVVTAGHLLPGLREIMADQRGNMALTALLSLAFGIWGSWLLAKQIKKQMFDLEPLEIARMFRERTAAFHAMHEGVIAIDNEENITIMNEKAKSIFGIDADVVGRPIREVIPDTRLPEILFAQTPVYNQEIIVGHALIWSNRIPIKAKDRTIGALAVFQDRTEVAHMAEELTGVKEFVDALRVQNHEYMNKLHTIAGLLQLDQQEKALDYLFQAYEQQVQSSRFLAGRIHDESISGLLLSKIGRGRELGIRVVVDERSWLERFPDLLDRHDFVMLFGNLIENAFDALNRVERNDKEVYVSIEQDDETLSILVEDNGIGMDEATKRRMLERGFSTKSAEGRGIGLYLVGRLLEKGRGELRCESTPGAGTTFIVTFPMRREEE